MVNSVLYFGAVYRNGSTNNQDRIRLDTFIRKANGIVGREHVTDHGQSTDDFWQMASTHSDLNLTVDVLIGLTDTKN